MTPQQDDQNSIYRYYVVLILVLVNTVNFIDRTVISVLAPDIQADLIDGTWIDRAGLGNTALGLVMGIAFTVFYATLGFPIGRLADRHNRVTLLAGVVTIWSGMTALCGAAANFVMLFLFRVGVGVGEAGAGPCAHSILADYFAKAQRPAVIGAFSLGVPMGIFIGITGGGYLVDWVGWRMSFVVIGLPGIVLALLVKLTIREPERGRMDDPADAAALRSGEDIKLWEGVKALWSIPTFRIMSYAAAPSALCGYGMNLWMPGFLVRMHELTASDYAFPLGLATGLGGGLGALAGGILTSAAAKRDLRAFLTYPAASMMVFAVALGIAIWSPSLTVVYAAVFVAAFCQFFLMGPFFSVVQRLAPLRGRAVATAFFFFILSAIGLGVGPAYVGGVNDLLSSQFGDAVGLQLSLGTLTVISVIAGLIALLGRGQIKADLNRMSGAPPPSAAASAPTASAT